MPWASPSIPSRPSAGETEWWQTQSNINPAARTADLHSRTPQTQNPGYFALTSADRRGGTRTALKEPVQKLYRTPVLRAERCLLTTAEQTENTAPRRVTGKGVLTMDNNAFQALMGYKSAMAQARLMRSKGLITAEEFAIIETKMCELFGINFDSLFRENDWIISEFRGNMSPTKGVT